jgi:hypothetical protein
MNGIISYFSGGALGGGGGGEIAPWDEGSGQPPQPPMWLLLNGGGWGDAAGARVGWTAGAGGIDNGSHVAVACRAAAALHDEQLHRRHHGADGRWNQQAD